MDINSSGSFLCVTYEGKPYYRLSYSPNYYYFWFEYDFFTGSMQNLSSECRMDFALAQKLEEKYKEMTAPKKSELNTGEMFKLLLKAVESREEFDSSEFQPNSFNYYRVRIKSNDAYLYHQPSKYVDSYLAAVFCEDRIEFYIPVEKYLGGNKRKNKINKLLTSICEYFNTASYCYKTSNNGEHIYHMKSEMYEPYEQIITEGPLEIPLKWDNS